MIFSYTQIARYLSCPHSYKYRYIEGWHETETRAPLGFGRAIEAGLAAYFRQDDSIAAFQEAWAQYRGTDVVYSCRDTWDKMLQQGITLLHLFAQQDRVRILQPAHDLQIRSTRAIDDRNEFVSYIDAIGELDERRCIIDWKTTTARYSLEPDGLLSLDPQLVCYSWMMGIEEVALVVFVRKSQPEIQYLRTRISAEEREQYAEMVKQTIQQINAWTFPPHSGIRFPQNGCVSCPYLGLCLRKPELIEKTIRHEAGGDLAWLDEVCD